MPIGKDKKGLKDKEKIRVLLLFLYRYFYFFSLILVIIVIVAGIFAFVIPKYRAISEEMKSRDEEKRLELDYLNKYQVELTKYKSSYDRIDKDDVNKVNKIYPEVEDIEELFTELAVLVKKNGLLLNSVELSKGGDKKAKKTVSKQEDSSSTEGQIPELPSDIGVISINLSISGVNYKSLKNILRTFENNLRILDIKNLSFKPEGSLSLEVETYYVQSDSE